MTFHPTISGEGSSDTLHHIRARGSGGWVLISIEGYDLGNFHRSHNHVARVFRVMLSETDPHHTYLPLWFGFLAKPQKRVFTRGPFEGDLANDVLLLKVPQGKVPALTLNGRYPARASKVSNALWH
jgi:hypothetical protein